MKRLNYSPSNKPLVIILSGPSGVGKDAVLNRMKRQQGPISFITTVTTRPKRVKEVDGIDYKFISANRFEEMIAGKELLEWAKVYDNFYGVPKAPIEKALAQGKDVVIKVDVQGAATIKQILPDAVFIFLMTPSIEELNRRLSKRLTESPSVLAKRLKAAEKEIEQLHLFDYTVTNYQNKLNLAVDEIKAIIDAEKCRTLPRYYNLS